MRIDTKKLKRAVLAYEDSVQNFSKDKIKADLKEIFKQFNINPSDFFTVNTNTGQKGEVSVSNYIDKLSDKIYKKSQEKNNEGSENKKQNTNSEQESSENASDQNTRKKRPNKHITFTLTGAELKSWTYDEIKPNLKIKLINAGITEEELNSPHTINLSFDDRVNISGNNTLLDKFVEFFSLLKYSLENNITIEEAISMKKQKDPSSEENKKNKANDSEEKSNEESNEELEELAEEQGLSL